jgi:putative SOS response-associated peptidase YedK
MINARGEEITDKTFFRPYFNNRCVVIVEGAFEWDSSRQPFAYKPNK